MEMQEAQAETLHLVPCLVLAAAVVVVVVS
jgi:hypothetical protein